MELTIDSVLYFVDWYFKSEYPKCSFCGRYDGHQGSLDLKGLDGTRYKVACPVCKDKEIFVKTHYLNKEVVKKIRKDHNDRIVFNDGIDIETLRDYSNFQYYKTAEEAIGELEALIKCWSNNEVKNVT